MGRLCPHTCLRAGVSGLEERWAPGPIASLLLASQRTTQPAASLPQDRLYTAHLPTLCTTWSCPERQQC